MGLLLFKYLPPPNSIALIVEVNRIVNVDTFKTGLVDILISRR